jgi:hypothetical protein
MLCVAKLLKELLRTRCSANVAERILKVEMHRAVTITVSYEQRIHNPAVIISIVILYKAVSIAVSIEQRPRLAAVIISVASELIGPARAAYAIVTVTKAGERDGLAL